MTDPTCPHCGTAIGEHEANACLDKWVFTAVMGYKTRQVRAKGSTNTFTVYSVFPREDGVYEEYQLACGWDWLPRYSSDISAAWGVLEHLRDKDCDVALCSAGATWLVESNVLGVTVRSESALLAICRAAVLAATGENP